jgi:hypothetical protein
LNKESFGEASSSALEKTILAQPPFPLSPFWSTKGNHGLERETAQGRLNRFRTLNFDFRVSIQNKYSILE